MLFWQIKVQKHDFTIRAIQACHDPAGRYQSVFSLAVHPDWQRQGCGRQLLNALIDLARREDRQAVTLTCRQEKIAYYESFGFV